MADLSLKQIFDGKGVCTQRSSNPNYFTGPAFDSFFHALFCPKPSGNHQGDCCVFFDVFGIFKKVGLPCYSAVFSYLTSFGLKADVVQASKLGLFISAAGNFYVVNSCRLYNLSCYNSLFWCKSSFLKICRVHFY